MWIVAIKIIFLGLSLLYLTTVIFILDSFLFWTAIPLSGRLCLASPHLVLLEVIDLSKFNKLFTIPMNKYEFKEE